MKCLTVETYRGGDLAQWLARRVGTPAIWVRILGWYGLEHLYAYPSCCEQFCVWICVLYKSTRFTFRDLLVASSLATGFGARESFPNNYYLSGSQKPIFRHHVIIIIYYNVIMPTFSEMCSCWCWTSHRHHLTSYGDGLSHSTVPFYFFSGYNNVITKLVFSGCLQNQFSACPI